MREQEIENLEKQPVWVWTDIHQMSLARMQDLIDGLSLHSAERAKAQSNLDVMRQMTLHEFKECFLVNLRSRNK